jgi:protein associated with RNAse G/E
MQRFEPGRTAVRRDVFRGSVWSAQALRVVRDDPDALVVACRPGAESMAATTFIASMLGGGDAVRKQALPDLAAGRWQLDRWTWRDTVLLLWNPPETYFSVNVFYDPSEGHRMLNWYVNFQRPLARTEIGFDTLDLLIDLVVAPDLSSWRWKDEDEYAQGRRLGVVGDADHQAVQQAREQVLAMIEKREGPFAATSGWTRWRSEPTWPTTTLPANSLTVDPG